MWDGRLRLAVSCWAAVRGRGEGLISDLEMLLFGTRGLGVLVVVGLVFLIAIICRGRVRLPEIVQEAGKAMTARAGASVI